ncbi:hypothetical protein [Pseudogulbenkiania sp. MAI-1]|uniref:hypothetical protein n=1 Tax=Pseudogulbenkiania sp. MAI-1 TaxID=990370 RepID=UPI00045EA04A|nr:hypothetical protein [Pseudogulbenkiania sp. MAI-1]
MQRVSASRNPALNLFGEGKHGFKAGNPATGEPATTPGFEMFNALQEEICSVIEGFGGALDPDKRDQLFSVMKGAGRVIHSISALKALKKTASTNVFVTGYYETGDGGGGEYWQKYENAPIGWGNNGSRITSDDGAGWELIVRGSVNVDQFGAQQSGSVAIQTAMDSGIKSIVFSGKTYTLTGKLVVPTGVSLHFEHTTLDGHFNDFMMTFAFPGAQKLSGHLTLTDSHADVVSAATTLTKGIEFGNTGSAIHDLDAKACTIYCSKLKRAYYFGEFSWTNEYGVLSSYNCGDAATEAVYMHTSGGNAPHDSHFVRLEVKGDNNPTWNGQGATLRGDGCSIGSLHVESIYANNGTTFYGRGWAVNGGYVENVGGAATSNTIEVDSAAKVTFSGVLVNCPLDLNSRTPLVGCRFFKSDLHKNATYIECKFPAANQLILDVTNIKLHEFPIFNGGSTPIDFYRFSGNWSEYGPGYIVPADFVDVDYYSGNHSRIIDSSAWSGNSFLMEANGGYLGAVAFKLNPMLVNTKVHAWAIVKIPSISGVSEIRVGVGGVIDTGNYDLNSRTVVYGEAYADKWVLVVLPDVTVYDNSFGGQALMVFEGTNETAGNKVYINAFGVETGGCTYKNLGTINSPEAKAYLKLDAPPTTGTWSVGDRVVKKTPAIGQSKGWTCAIAGTPGTWGNEGNLQ